MSDKNKKGKDDPKPLKDAKVDVHAEPKNRHSQTDCDAAHKVAKTVKEKVEEAIKKKASEGAEEQLKEVDKEIDNAKDAVSPRFIKKLRVKVSGKDADDDQVVRERTVTPKEGGPKKDE